MAVVDRARLKKLTDVSPISARLRASAIGPAWVLLVDIIDVFRRHRTPMLARQAAYSLLFAVPSAVLLVVALANLIDRRAGSRLSDELFELIRTSAPVEMRAILDDVVRQALIETSANQATIAAIISIAVAIWSGAAGTGSLILACNIVYDVTDRRSFLVRQIMKLALTVLQGIVFLASLILFAIGHRAAEWLSVTHGYDSRILTILSSGRSISVGLVLALLLLLYSVAPDVEKQYRWLVPGTIVAATGITGLFALIDTLLKYFNPSAAYGIPGSVLIFLWFLYLMSLVVITGAVVNAAVGARHDGKLRAFLEANPERRIYGRPKNEPPPLIE